MHYRNAIYPSYNPSTAREQAAAQEQTRESPVLFRSLLGQGVGQSVRSPLCAAEGTAAGQHVAHRGLRQVRLDPSESLALNEDRSVIIKCRCNSRPDVRKRLLGPRGFNFSLAAMTVRVLQFVTIFDANGQVANTAEAAKSPRRRLFGSGRAAHP